MSIKHLFQSAKSDGGDATLVQPGDWNDDHVVDDYVVFPEESAPSTAAAATVRVYAKSDGLLYSKDDAGTETLVSGGPGGSSGALVLLEQHTASSSPQLDFTTFISSTYDDYVIEIVDIAPASNAVNLQVEMGTGGGPTYDTGNNYEWGFAGRSTGGGSPVYNGSSGVAILMSSMSNNGGYGHGSGSFRAQNLQSTAHRKTLFGTCQYVDSAPGSNYVMGGMQWTTTGTAVTALRFLMSSGNIASGTIRIYGLAK